MTDREMHDPETAGGCFCLALIIVSILAIFLACLVLGDIFFR